MKNKPTCLPLLLLAFLLIHRLTAAAPSFVLPPTTTRYSHQSSISPPAPAPAPPAAAAIVHLAASFIPGRALLFLGRRSHFYRRPLGLRMASDGVAAGATTPNTNPLSFPSFLKQARSAVFDKTSTGKKWKVVMGNEAADADSIVSSLCLAYFLQMTRVSSSSSTTADTEQEMQYVPVLPLARAEMKLRPETLLLLRLAKLGDIRSDLVHIDELDLIKAAGGSDGEEGGEGSGPLAGIVLVDHNKLCEAYHKKLGKLVEEIVDHHEDQWFYEWVPVVRREVAFSNAGDLEMDDGGTTSLGGQQGGNGNSMASLSTSLSQASRSSSAGGRALVASTCTLVAERFLAHQQNPNLLDPQVALLLLGVIMLDAAGLDVKAGKVTARDLAAVAALETPALQLWEGHGQSHVKSKEVLYNDLSGAKFDKEWWRSLEVKDALGLDYKSFKVKMRTRPPFRYGMSSVLVPLNEILGRTPIIIDTLLHTFTHEREVELLVLMSLIIRDDDGALQREFAIYTPTRTHTQQELGAFLAMLLQAAETEAAGLGLTPLELELPLPLEGGEGGGGEGGGGNGDDGGGRKLWCFAQGNTQASRKQVQPILQRVLEMNEEKLFPGGAADGNGGGM